MMESYFSAQLPRIVVKELDVFSDLQNFHDSASKEGRTMELEGLRRSSGLPLTEPHWQQWIDMADF